METNTMTFSFTRSTLHLTRRAFNRSGMNATGWWFYLDTLSDEQKRQMREIVAEELRARDRLATYKNSFRFRTKIRKYCNLHVGTDCFPYEVVKIVSERCVEVRAMHAEQTVFPKEVYIGGFSAHTADNHAQRYAYSSNESNRAERIRLGKKGWANGRFRMSDDPYKFYDYNF